ncbi:MAG TPA: dsDNA nuclease domain-containing protein [Pedobacter sp.]|jgi:hypothetical protein
MRTSLPDTPPDNTGSETLDRYRYQAQIAVRFCLECITGRNVSVFLEHFEDIVVEYADKWLFIQVKTKEPHLQPWTFSGAHSGLQSLYRTFKSISKINDINAEYCLFLEGGIKFNDPLNDLVLPARNINQNLVEKVRALLKIDDTECRKFLNVLYVQPNQPSKDLVQQDNIAMIGEVSPNTPVFEVKDIEKKLTDEILTAMAATRLKNKLFQHVCKTRLLNLDSEIVKQKRFTHVKLTSILGTTIDGSYPLLRRYTDASLPTPSNLERKMIKGGAKDAIIKRAKELRANSTYRLVQLQTSSLYDISDKIDDANFRHEQWAETIIARLGDVSSSANLIWSEMTDKLMTSHELRENLAPSSLFRDPMLILGNICDLSDQCKFGWGEGNA